MLIRGGEQIVNKPKNEFEINTRNFYRTFAVFISIFIFLNSYSNIYNLLSTYLFLFTVKACKYMYVDNLFQKHIECNINPKFIPVCYKCLCGINICKI